MIAILAIHTFLAIHVILAIQSIQVVRIYKPYFTRQAKAMIVAGKAKGRVSQQARRQRRQTGGR